MWGGSGEKKLKIQLGLSGTSPRFRVFAIGVTSLSLRSVKKKKPRFLEKPS